MTIEQDMMRFPITAEAWIAAGKIFTGIAIPCDKSTADGGTIRSEKILRFNRKALRHIGKASKAKADPRYGGGEDRMIVAVGKPGSRERVEALRSQYDMILASGEEVSPFRGD
jgi:hypothetical protein